jgi:hypothetical protein
VLPLENDFTLPLPELARPLEWPLPSRAAAAGSMLLAATNRAAAAVASITSVLVFFIAISTKWFCPH